MFRKLYGTDGIRGLYGEEITPELAFEIGRSAAVVFERENEENHIVIGYDTRRTADCLVSALISGICSYGTNAINLGVVPTAFVPFSVKKQKAVGGIMVTASHNPEEYAGFKFFNGNGYKISDEQEDKIEYILTNPENYPYAKAEKTGRTWKTEDRQDYIQYLKDNLSIPEDIKKIVIDCAAGSSAEFAYDLFKDCGAEVVFVGLNGKINDGCGTEHADFLRHEVVRLGADIGFALDGDGDRLRVCDPCGNLISGEEILFYLAQKNKNKKIITSEISNMGLLNSLHFCGTDVDVTPLGEKNIVNALLSQNLTLGGEKNGHLIFLNKSTTSDGLLSCAVLLSSIDTKYFRSECEKYLPYYQKNKNFKISGKNCDDIVQSDYISEKLNISQNLLGENGRVMLRKSGTENLLRLLVEGYNINLVEKIEKELTEAIDFALKNSKVFN